MMDGDVLYQCIHICIYAFSYTISSSPRKSSTFSTSRDKKRRCCRVVTDRARRIIIIKKIEEKGNEQKETKEYFVRMCVDQSKKWESIVMILGKNEKERKWMMTTKNEFDVIIMLWKNPNDTRPLQTHASAAVLSKLFYTLSLAFFSSSLYWLLYRSIIITRWMKVNDRDEKRKKERNLR